MGASINVPLFVPLIAACFAAIGWLLKRKLTSASKVERLDLASKLLDVRSKLKSPDLTSEQIDDILRTSGVERSLIIYQPNTLGDVVRNDTDYEPPILSTTAAMGARLDAELKVIEAKIEQRILDIEILSNHSAKLFDGDLAGYDDNHVRKMYRAWQLYKTRAGHSMMYDYFGGTIAGPMFFAEEIRIAETFLADLDERLNSLKM